MSTYAGTLLAEPDVNDAGSTVCVCDPSVELRNAPISTVCVCAPAVVVVDAGTVCRWFIDTLAPDVVPLNVWVCVSVSAENATPLAELFSELPVDVVPL